MSTAVQQPRKVERVVAGQATQDGAGVKLTRLLTQDLQRRLDPFLMLDNFASDDPNDYGAGFPDHPHRGFETVTYMISGRMRHRDSQGHEGLLQNGGVQWMTAGRGLVHSEMPEQEQGLMEGFQLWLNLPARDKLREPWYRDIQSDQIPEVRTPAGVTVRVIAGESQGVRGSVQREVTEPLYLDLHFDADPAQRFEQPLPAGHNAFICVYRGSVQVGEGAAASVVSRGQLAILADGGDGVLLRPAPGSAEAPRALLIAGQPLREPIAQYGPFVMNTREQLLEAVEDFNRGRFG
ncbi:pirin family protein [Ramlibacter tataouinensis]|uniref:pirin family protein n=1 Tax=Ramlibacter tataouinensis TaxID=94132 RepID=UPI0022F3BA14|nr:pirin family protein [Ramlibacter tataouinensis]WBY00028.1 pirin family protein [Ramlibacter tataouinensis]